MTTFRGALGLLALMTSSVVAAPFAAQDAAKPSPEGTARQPAKPPAAPAPVSPVKATGPFIFDCRAQGTEVGELHVTFYATQPGLVMLDHLGVAKPAFQVRAASGAKFEGDGVSFWEARGEAAVQWPGSDMICTRRQEEK